MNTDATWQIDCDGLSSSLALGEQIGTALKGGEIIELISDLGGGKTTFVKGIATGAGSTDQVSSPTFTLSNIYTGTNVAIHHYDFYRLGQAGIMSDELSETLSDPKAVTVIEWAEIIHDVLPTDYLTIRITVTGDTSRSFVFEAHGNAIKLLQKVRT